MTTITHGNILVTAVKEQEKPKQKGKKQNKDEHKIIHAPGHWNQQHFKPSTLFLNCVTGWRQIAWDAAVKAVKECFIVSRYGDVALSLTHSLTFCFVGLDLFCCTPGDLLFPCRPSLLLLPPPPLPPLAGRLKAKADGRYQSAKSLKS